MPSDDPIIRKLIEDSLSWKKYLRSYFGENELTPDEDYIPYSPYTYIEKSVIRTYVSFPKPATEKATSKRYFNIPIEVCQEFTTPEIEEKINQILAEQGDKSIHLSDLTEESPIATAELRGSTNSLLKSVAELIVVKLLFWAAEKARRENPTLEDEFFKRREAEPHAHL